ELADAAQRTDQLRRFDREQDGLGVRAGRELADRLGVFLRDEIVDRLVATLRDRVRHHLRRLGFGFGLAFAGFGLAERRLALAFGREDRALLFTLGAQDADRKSTRLNSSHVKNSYAVFCLKKKKKDPT